MANQKDKKKAKYLEANSKKLHKTDPQNNMEGPISSMVQSVKENVEDEISKEEADKKKEENM